MGVRGRFRESCVRRGVSPDVVLDACTTLRFGRRPVRTCRPGCTLCRWDASAMRDQELARYRFEMETVGRSPVVRGG